MYHVCVFTNQFNQKFLAIGGSGEEDILMQLQKIIAQTKLKESYEKLVLLRSYLDTVEGEAFGKRISLWAEKELRNLIVSENESFNDLRKHLPK